MVFTFSGHYFIAIVHWGKYPDFFSGDSLYGLIEAKLTAWVGGISWLQWVTTTTSVLIKIVLRILYFFLFVAFGGYIVLVVMSPVYSWAVRTDRGSSYRKGISL